MLTMLKDESDEALMLRYQRGEVRAFELLLERHSKRVFNFILRFVKQRNTAEDLLQESFLRVVRNAQRYKQKAKFTTWLYTIARNLCVDQSRRAVHRKTQSLDTPLGSEGHSTLLDIIPGDHISSERALDAQKIQRQLHLAIDTLPNDQREVFWMRESLGMPFKEIAEITKSSENTVKSRMRYALLKLRSELHDLQDIALSS